MTKGLYLLCMFLLIPRIGDSNIIVFAIVFNLRAEIFIGCFAFGRTRTVKLDFNIENLPAHSRDFSREVAGRILSEKISRNADFFCSFCCAYGIIKMVINI